MMRSGPGSAIPQPIMDRRDLREFIVEHFSPGELAMLCDDVQADLEAYGIEEPVSVEMVGGAGLPEIVRNLIKYLNDRGYLGFLEVAVRRLRPGVFRADVRPPQPPSEKPVQPIPASFAPTKISDQEKSALVEALLACDSMKDTQTRDAIVASLPDVISTRVKRLSSARGDVFSIVTRCLALPPDQGIRLLVEQVRFHEGPTPAMMAVEELVRRVEAMNNANP